MGIEIERKFIVDNLLPLCNAERSRRMRQGYLSLDIDRTVRVRVIDDEAAWLTVKGRNDGNTRKEFEYKIPSEEGAEMLEMCEGGFIDKVRYFIPTAHFVIELDVFDGDNNGLIVAEIEFDEVDERKDLSEGELQHYLPEWIGKEVTNDTRYYNSSLLTFPYNTWSK